MSAALAIDPVRRPSAGLPAAPVQAPEAPAVAPAARPAARPLARPRRLTAAAVVVVTGIGAVLGGQLLLSIGSADGAYRLARLQTESVDLTRRTQVQQEALRDAAAPQRLAAAATAQGLVPAGSAAFLDARTGRVTGDTTPAGATAP